MGFWAGVLVGWLSMFAGLYALSQIAKRMGTERHESSVTTIRPDGSKKTVSRSRPAEKVRDDGGKAMGENATEKVGENVHAVLRRQAG